MSVQKPAEALAANARFAIDEGEVYGHFVFSVHGRTIEFPSVAVELINDDGEVGTTIFQEQSNTVVWSAGNLKGSKRVSCYRMFEFKGHPFCQDFVRGRQTDIQPLPPMIGEGAISFLVAFALIGLVFVLVWLLSNNPTVSEFFHSMKPIFTF